jgi:hypothetical protein
MAIGVLFDGGISQEQYEQVGRSVAQGDGDPTGMLFHAAGPSEDGFCVVEVWESPEALQQFMTERLGSALQQAGITAEPKFFRVIRIEQP